MAHKALKGAPRVWAYSVVQYVRCLMDLPLYCSAVNDGVWRGKGCGHGSNSYTLFSSIVLLPRLPGFPPQAFPTIISSQIPSIRLSAVNSSPCTRIAPQSLNSSSQPLPLPGDSCSCPAYIWLLQGLSDSHSIQAATDQLFHSQP